MPNSPDPSGTQPVPLLLTSDWPELEALLSGPGIRLDRADSPVEIVRHLESTRYAAIVLTGTDKLEIAGQIRSGDKDDPTPILFVTGQDAKSFPAKGFELGTVDWISEPFVPEVVRGRIGLLIDLYRANRRVRQLERAAAERARPPRIAHAVALILAETPDAPEAVDGVLRSVGTAFGWDAGALWLTQPGSDVIRLAAWWTADGVSLPGFEAASRATGFRIGTGIPGRAWATDQPIWVSNLGADGNFPRLQAAAADGLKSGAATSVRACGEFFGVIEYYSRESRRTDPEVLSDMVGAGAAIGHFLRRRHTESALRESEKRFTRFMTHLPGLAWIKDPDGRYAYANDAAVRAFGRSREELYGRTDDELFPAETAAQFRDHDRKVLSGPAGLQVIETLRHPDGTVRHSLVSKFPVPMPDGRLSVGGMAIDITDRMRAEAALRESEARLHAVIKGMPAIVYVKDLAGRYLLVNPAFGELLRLMHGITPEEALGKTDADYFPGELAAALMANDRQVASAGCVMRFEEVVNHPDGPHTYASLKFPLRDEAGMVYAVCGVSTDIEDQRRAARTLDRYRLLSQHTRDIVLFIRPADGQVIEANDAAVAAYGYDRETLLTRRVSDLRAPGTTPKVGPQLLAADTVGVRFETVHVRRDGTTFPVEVNSCGADVGGERLLLSIIRDISDRQRAERERTNLVSLVETSSDLVGLAHMDGRILYFNDAGLRLLGLSGVDEARQKTLFDFVLPEDLAALKQELLPSLAEHGRWEGEWRYRHTQTGAAIPVSKKVTVIRDPATGEPWAYATVSRDITDRVRAEEAVRRSEIRYRRLVEESPLSIQILNPEGYTLNVNRAWEILWGGNPAEHLRDYNLRTDPQLQALGLAPQIERAFTGEGVELPAVGYVPDRGSFAGQERWVRAFMYPVKDSAGRIEEVVLIHEDITERRRAEEALQEANRRKDEFLAMLAHELRNPLAPIRNAAQVLRLVGPVEPRLREVRDVIDRQVGHLGRLVDDLLDVARIARGKMHLHPEPIDLSQVVCQAVGDHRAAFHDKHVTLELETPDAPAWVNGDSTRLAQILDNLLTNALKFTPVGGLVTVTVAAAGGQVVLAVQDTGAGIDADLQSRLFQPFNQADRTLDRSHGGLGLGLAIVRGLTELHGGTVMAQSAGPGQGTTFTVTIPAAAEAPALKSEPAGPKAASGSIRVLVVEDNRDAADSLRVLLEALGYRASVAYTGADGLQAARSQRPDVIVCDIGLPGLDGYGVAAALRADPATASIRLIALTGYGREEDQERARAAGFDHHLTKPADPAALIRLFSDVE